MVMAVLMGRACRARGPIRIGKAVNCILMQNARLLRARDVQESSLLCQEAQASALQPAQETLC